MITGILIFLSSFWLCTTFFGLFIIFLIMGRPLHWSGSLIYYIKIPILTLSITGSNTNTSIPQTYNFKISRYQVRRRWCFPCCFASNHLCGSKICYQDHKTHKFSPLNTRIFCQRWIWKTHVYSHIKLFCGWYWWSYMI